MHGFDMVHIVWRPSVTDGESLGAVEGLSIVKRSMPRWGSLESPTAGGSTHTNL